MPNARLHSMSLAGQFFLLNLISESLIQKQCAKEVGFFKKKTVFVSLFLV